MFQFGTGDIAAISITPVTQSFQGCFRFPNTIPAGAGRLCVIKKNIIFSNYQSIYPRITWRFKVRHVEIFQWFWAGNHRRISELFGWFAFVCWLISMDLLHLPKKYEPLCHLLEMNLWSLWQKPYPINFCPVSMVYLHWPVIFYPGYFLRIFGFERVVLNIFSPRGGRKGVFVQVLSIYANGG